MTSPPEFLTAVQLAEYLGVTLADLAVLGDFGRLPPTVTLTDESGRYVYVRRQIDAWLTEGCPVYDVDRYEAAEDADTAALVRMSRSLLGQAREMRA